MGNEEDMISQLFRTTFEEHAVPMETGEWEGLNTRLTKRNFFHFNAFQFNVYYAGMIIFCFITCVFVGTHYMYTNFFKKEDLLAGEGKGIRNEGKGKKVNRNFVVIPTDGKSGVGGQNNQPILIKSNQANLLSRKQKKSIENTDLTKVKDSESTVLDTNRLAVPNSVSAPVVLKPDSAKPKPKRIVYITKQDTIVQFDTVQAPKKKKKWFK